FSRIARGRTGSMKIMLGVIALGLAIVAIILLRQQGPRVQELTPDERSIRDLVHEVYGPNIVSERVTYSVDEAALKIRLRDEKVSSLEINLSQLARKHREEGLTLAVIRTGLRFDDLK